MVRLQIKQLLHQVYNIVFQKNISLGYVFMLHRVGCTDKNGLPANENLKVSPEKLESLLIFLKNKYDFIRTDDIPDRLNSQVKKPFVAFTMDDGYKDNLTEALPIFKKYNCPFTIFLATDFMDKKAILWWYALESLIQSNKILILSDGTKYDCRENKNQVFLSIRRRILELNQESLGFELNQLFANYTIDWEELVDKLCLSWEDVKILKKEPLVTLGAHTQHHYNLKAMQSKELVRQEVYNGWERLKERVEINATVFAYPFGTSKEAGEREFSVLSSLNGTIKVAFRSIDGPITKEDSNLFSLPRVFLTNDFDWRKSMKIYGKVIK